MNTAVDKISLKKMILDAAIGKHESVMNDFRQRIQDMIVSEKTDNEEEYDNHQQAFKMETMAEVNLLNDQLEFANHERDELARMDSYIETIHDCVEFGSVVKTDKETFFVSSSIERFYVDGMSLFGLSVHSPLYKIMKGKRKGESFEFGDKRYTILEIF